MKRAFGVTVAFMLVLAVLEAQEAQELVKSYKRNFAIASLDVKIQILQDAASGNSKEMGSLYHQAVDFVLDNTSLIPSDPRFRQLAGVAVAQIRALSYAEARYSVAKLFQADTETSLRVSCLNALGVIGQGDGEIVQNLNRWQENQNNVFQTGKIPDLQVISASVRALGQLGDPSSFPVLLSASILGYSEETTKQAREALLAIKGDLQDLLTGVIKSSPLPEKKQALAMALESDRLADDKKAAVAEYALDMGLHLGARDALQQGLARELRFSASRALSDRKWSKATPLMIEHFNNTLLEVDRGITSKTYLLEAVAGLGNMGTQEAAVRLTQYLILLNSYSEKSQVVDEQIMLALVGSLGKLGNKVAFDDLMYTQYLNYSAPVKKAARQALENLKW